MTSSINPYSSTTAAWTMLENMRRAMNIRVNDENGMQKLMRAFAIEVCRKQTDSVNQIKAGGCVLHQFPSAQFNSRQAYLSYHAKDRTWGEDALMMPALEVLGYQPVMHLQDTEVPPYLPFTQKNSNPIIIDIVNTGAESQGTHWELKGHTNCGGGNCMYHTMAQQVQKNIASFQATLPVQEKPASAPAVNKRVNNQSEQSGQDVVAQVLKHSVNYAQQVQNTRMNALRKLDALSTVDLASLYKKVMSAGSDRYLQGRLKDIARENGINPEHSSDFIRNAVYHNIISTDFEDIIREELLHGLAVESAKNAAFFKCVLDKDFSCFEPTSNGNNLAAEDAEDSIYGAALKPFF